MMRFSRRATLAGVGASLLAPGQSLHAGSGPPRIRGLAVGVNLAGAEFGAVPGRHGSAYLYPGPSNFDTYVKQGFTLVRLPFKWERLQPRLREQFDAEEAARLQTTVRHGTDRGLIVVLDPHNYGKRRLLSDNWATEHMIGSRELPADAFVQFWTHLASLFAHAPQVHFGLMNEPTLPSAHTWREIAQTTVLAIRETGARNRVYVPGIAYTGAHSWMRAGNDIMGTVRDPAGDLVIEVHQYLDRDSSGTHPGAVSASIGSERLRSFQTWAKANGVRAFLGEFGAARDARSVRALIDMLDEVAAHPEVWTGVAAWAGGPRWPPDEMFNLEPDSDGSSKPQTAALSAFARDAFPVPLYRDAAPALYFDRRRAASGKGLASSSAPAALAALTEQRPFALMVEIAEADLQTAGPLVESSGITWIGVVGGRFWSALSPVTAAAVRTGSAETRVRALLTLDGSTVMLVATGAQPQRGELAKPLPDMQQKITIAPRVTRIVGFAHSLGEDRLADLVA